MKKLAWLLAAAVAACSSDPATPAGAPTDDAGSADPIDAEASDAGGGGTCSAATEQLLGPVDEVSTGEVKVLSDDAGVKTLFVDASAGGQTGARTEPRLYVNLETSTRVEVTDESAAASTAWDLALKRPVLFTNSGQAGSGQGGAVLVSKDFDAVTAADVSSATFETETFFDDACTPNVDQTGAVKTSFDGWYKYNQSTHALSPRPGTWLVKGGTGKPYKVEIVTFNGKPDGGEGGNESSGRYVIKVAAL